LIEPLTDANNHQSNCSLQRRKKKKKKKKEGMDGWMDGLMMVID